MRRLPSLTALRFFEETARQLSFGKAAKALFVTQGAVSRQIKSLEQSLGVTLFERHSHGLVLTDNGRALLPWVTDAFDRLEDGVTTLEPDDGSACLRLVAPPAFATHWLSPRLGALATQMPQVEVSLLTAADERCDCEIRFGTGAEASGHSELLFVERHVLMGPPWLADAELDDLLDKQPLLHVLEGGLRLGMWTDWLAKAGREVERRRKGIEFSSLTQVIRAARKGVGLALIDAHMAVEELAEGDLVPLSDIEVNGPYGYWLDIPQRSMTVGRVQAFAQWLQEEASRAQ